jgi:hypothetical protein
VCWPLGSAGKDSIGIYESSTDALKQINEAFDYWSGQITATSLQMCYALIGANWVIFGSVENILHSRYAIVSLLLVLLALAFNMGIRLCAHRVHEEQVRLRCFRPQALGG